MTTSIQQPTKRIEYIDALRGLTMILVVFSHVELSCMGITTPTYLNEVLMSFRMPLFFFISGYIAYKESLAWDWGMWRTMSRKKLVVQLVPTLILGLLYTYAYYGTDWQTFVTANGKLGYWFTIVLLEMFLILYTTNTCLYTPDRERYRKRMTLTLLLLAGILFVAKMGLKMSPTLNTWANVGSWHHLCSYFQYFAFGYICSMHKERFAQLLEARYTMAIVIGLYALIFGTKKYLIATHLTGSIDLWKVAETLSEALIGYLGLIIVYNTFKTYQNGFTRDKRVGKALQLIGTRTLDIYLLHSFFMPHLPQLSALCSEGKNAVVELFLGGGIALSIIALCLCVSAIIRTSPMLAKLLFGVSKKKG